LNLGPLPYQVSSVSSSMCGKPGSGVGWLPGSSRYDLRWTTSSGRRRARRGRPNSACEVPPRWCRENPAACRVGDSPYAVGLGAGLAPGSCMRSFRGNVRRLEACQILPAGSCPGCVGAPGLTVSEAPPSTGAVRSWGKTGPSWGVEVPVWERTAPAGQLVSLRCSS
jgi:hypothetical protein